MKILLRCEYYLSIIECFQTQLEELRASNGSLRQTLLDPIVNTMFQKIKHELRVYREKLDQSQQDMNAWKFTPDRLLLFVLYSCYSFYLFALWRFIDIVPL